MSSKGSGSLAALFFLSLSASSCAPTTGALEGTTDTFGNTTDATSDLTSSTSPSDSDEAKAAKVQQFAKVNFNRLRSDMAVGQGEYLRSLAILMEIDDAKRDDFYRLTKEHFDRLFVSAGTTSDELIANLRNEVLQP